MKKKVTIELGQRLKKIREGLGMTQWTFARKMGMSNTHLSEIEAGKFGPGFYFFYRLVKSYNINPLYLLLGQEPEFLEREEEKKAEEEPEPQPEPGLESMDFGENTARIREMLSYFERSPVVKFSVLGFYSKFVIENKAIIEEDIKSFEESKTGEA
jgi:transcriptional regulator with XRE-family HTH domain